MSSGVFILFLIVVVIALVGLVALLIRARGSGGRSDGMTSFQRQIDALSPEARRPVVDQVKKAASEDDDDADPRGKRGR